MCADTEQIIFFYLIIKDNPMWREMHEHVENYETVQLI